MAESINQHYDMLSKMLNGNKDSIFEPCRVIEFDSKTLQATVYGTRSKQTKENVIVMFPSFFLNSGMISFPVPESIGIIFVGPDNENYMLPAQFFLPTKTAVNGMAKSNGAPGQFDNIFSLENLEPGELLFRSLNGAAQIFISNSGEIELLTNKLHRISLNEVDGSFEEVVERERKTMGYSTWYNGAHEAIPEEKDLYEQHMHATIHEEIPNWEKTMIDQEKVLELIQENKDLRNELLITTKTKPKVYKQEINVYEEKGRGEFRSVKQKSSVDGEELYSKVELLGTADGDEYKNTRNRLTKEVSKEGAIELSHEKGELSRRYNLKANYDKIELNMESGTERSNIKTTPEEVVLYKGNANGSDVSLILNDGNVKLSVDGTDLIVRDGDILFQLDKQYSLKSIINRINAISPNSMGPL